MTIVPAGTAGLESEKVELTQFAVKLIWDHLGIWVRFDAPSSEEEDSWHGPISFQDFATEMAVPLEMANPFQMHQNNS